MAEPLNTVSTCCAPSEQVDCCAPEDKEACCGPAHAPGRCGCGAGAPTDDERGPLPG